jgi:hypothetical protein
MGGVAVASTGPCPIHFTLTGFPVRETACGLRPDFLNEFGHPCRHPCPSVDRWRYVSCVACLRTVAHDPRIRKMIADLEEQESYRRDHV